MRAPGTCTADTPPYCCPEWHPALSAMFIHPRWCAGKQHAAWQSECPPLPRPPAPLPSCLQGFWMNNGYCSWPVDHLVVGTPGGYDYSKLQLYTALDLATGLPALGRAVKSLGAKGCGHGPAAHRATRFRTGAHAFQTLWLAVPCAMRSHWGGLRLGSQLPCSCLCWPRGRPIWHRPAEADLPARPGHAE